jgi:hypothetical protein
MEPEEQEERRNEFYVARGPIEQAKIAGLYGDATLLIRESCSPCLLYFRVEHEPKAIQKAVHMDDESVRDLIKLLEEWLEQREAMA